MVFGHGSMKRISCQVEWHRIGSVVRDFWRYNFDFSIVRPSLSVKADEWSSGRGFSTFSDTPLGRPQRHVWN